LLKFIERNWRLPTVSSVSLDHLPNPVNRHGNPYVPENRPAIGDMFDMFDFNQPPAGSAAVRAPRLRGGQRMSRALVHIPNSAR
jgi:hypothetical protein